MIEIGRIFPTRKSSFEDIVFTLLFVFPPQRNRTRIELESLEFLVISIIMFVHPVKTNLYIIEKLA